MNTPTEREKQIITDTRIRIVNYLYGRMKDPIRRFEEDELDLIILSAIQDAKQGNEDTARLREALSRLMDGDWTNIHCHVTGKPTQGKCHGAPREDCAGCRAYRFADAARAVQPAAKEEDGSCYPPVCFCGTPMKDHDPYGMVGCTTPREMPAAKEESAEPCFLCGGVGGHREICPAAKESVQIIGDDFVIAPAAQQESAPAAASVDERQLDSLAQVVFDLDEENVLDVTRLELVEKFSDALSASSPSEQKSSLPAETLSAQERESQETGKA